MDSIVQAWIAEIPGLDGASLELALYAIRLDSILHNALDSAIGEFGLTRSDFDVLTALHASGRERDIRHSELKAHLVLSSGGATNILNRLEQRGLIERVHNMDDGRSKHVRLTPLGEDLTVQAIHAYVRVHNVLFRNMTTAQTHNAARALRQVMSALHDDSSPRNLL